MRNDTGQRIAVALETLACGPVKIGRIPPGKVSIIGDSISTFDGYLYETYVAYYPKSDGDVQNVADCWWYKAITSAGARLEVNAAYSGSAVTDIRSPRPTFYGRCSQAILGNPDTILVALGTNDSMDSAPLGDYDFETTYTSLSESTFRPAYIKGMSALKALYPNATIIAAIFMMGDAYKQSIATICDKMDIACVDCSHYTIYSTVHPDANGMAQIASQFSAGTDLSRATEMLGATQVSVLYNGVPTSELFTASAIRVAVWGHMLIVSLEGLIPTARMTSWATVASGFPAPIIAPYQAIIANAEMSASEISLTRKLRVRVASNGSLQIREGDAGQSYTGFYACVV